MAQDLFLRLLGLTYIVAFASIWVQIDGLIGSHGILPADAIMSQERDAGATFRFLPS